MVTRQTGIRHPGIPQPAATPRTLGVPWWYRYIRSWRTRMWIETGIWLHDPSLATAVTPLNPAQRGLQKE